MRTNSVKRKLEQGQVTWGTWITSGDLYVTKALLPLGFDWLTVDMEHAPLDWSRVAELVGTIADAGVVPFVRIPEGTPFYIKRALDLGAFGLIVPMVESVGQARQAIRAGRYPPQGTRSAGGGLHHLHFAATLEEYLARADGEIVLVLQIESPLGVERSEQIAAVPGCDALLVGPLDLETRIRAMAPPEQVEERFATAVHRVIHAARRHGKVCGFHARHEVEALHWAAQGMQLMAVGNDIGFVTRYAQQLIDKLRGGLKGNT